MTSPTCISTNIFPTRCSRNPSEAKDCAIESIDAVNAWIAIAGNSRGLRKS